MKVKVKGLVFAGFAAAVFAQSAMATDPAPGDLKTVTSKAYVDSKFDFTNGQVIMQGDGRGVTAAKDVVTVGVTDAGQGLTNQMIAANDAALPTVSAVRQYVDNAVSSGVGALTPAVGANAGSYVDFTESNGTFTVEFDNAVVTAASGVIQANDASLITSGGVRDYAQAKSAFKPATEGTDGNNNTTYTTNISSTSSNAEYPSSKNVYEYVEGRMTDAAGAYQPKVATSDNTTVYVGRNGTGNAPTWDALSTDGYVTTDTTTSGVYKITLDSSKITTGSDFGTIATGNAFDATSEQTAAAVAAEAKLATAGAVYDYVESRMGDADGAYQAKATGTNVQIGYNGTWHTLSGDSTYITVSDAGSGATVTLNNVAGTITDGQNTVSTIATATGTDLPTVANVKTYVDAQIAALPTNATNLPSGCENGTHYCALVATKNSTTGVVTYEWTVMAPTGN